MAVEACLAVFSGIVSEGAKPLFIWIKRRISYVFKHQSFIDELKDQAKQLGNKREMVQQPVHHARRQGDEIYEGVTDWLNEVDEFSEGVAKSIIDDEGGAKKSCFKGLCPNLISRYKLSKQAAKAAEDAASLTVKGNFSNVSYRPAPDKAEFRDVKDFEAFDSRTKVFQDVVEALKDDKLNIIGVYGMGGVGKTTLVKQVANQVTGEDKLFDKVVMAEVTQRPDHHKIQDKLAFDLGMEFGLNENEFQRAERLHERLKKEKRVLIILDNIWKELQLDKVGIPSGDVDEKDRKDDQRRCTIIMTSRSLDLLCNDMRSKKNFSINVLSEKEALQLFKKIVGESARASAFQPLADQIVGKCGGLPVAVSTVANALKNKRLAIWKDALNQLQNSNLREIRGMDANVYSSIELSYKLLERDEAKSLFLLCSLYGQGHSLKIPSLLRNGMGLTLFKNVYTLEEARNRMDTLIDNLKSSCLLLDGDSEDEAKMHDIIHAVAVSIASEKLMFNIANVADLKEEIEKTIEKEPTAISLPLNIRNAYELPEQLECPKLKLLWLFAEYGSPLLIPDLFFAGMKQLKVLHFTNARNPSLPSSLGCLFNVQTLCLESCKLNDITIIGQLKKLEILSFRGSDIEQLPLEIGQLTRLQLLDLGHCWNLKVIAPNVISKLSRLEELYMGNSFRRWEKVEGGSNASLVELKGLSKLTTLEIHIRDAEILPPDWVSVELQRYMICIGTKWRSWYIKSETSRLMWLEGLEKVSILLENDGMKKLLKGTEDLRLKRLKSVHELDCGEGFPRLKHLQIQECSEILHIVGSVGRVRCKVFPLLETLYLFRLTNLETICHSQLTEDQSFSNLRIIEVKYCHKLKHIFSFSMAKNLLRLQKAEVRACDNLEMIVGTDTEKRTTTLGFKEIIAEDNPVIFPRLEELQLDCLETIEKLWPDQFQGVSYCGNLTKVIVWGCGRLKYLFSYSMVKSLSQLQHLRIISCFSMEGVVDTTGWSERGEGKLIELKVFPKLRSIWLRWLPKLTSFANTGHIHSDLVVEFPSLLNLEIEGCSKMLRFISMSSPEDNIHTEMQPPPLFDEKVRLPRLEVLRIRRMDNLRKIWHHRLASESFSSLKELHIGWCDNLMYIFPPLVGIPSSLVNLNVSGCKNIEEIIGHFGEGVKGNCVAFSELKLLILDHLPRLTSFCLENYTLELEQVSVTRCPNMKTFSLGVLSTPKLYKVQVTKKGEKEGELYHWEGNNLNSTIQKCYKEMIGFRGIHYLTLSHFPRLKEIWRDQAMPVSFFNNLRELVVDDCTNMSSAIPAICYGARTSWEICK